MWIIAEECKPDTARKVFVRGIDQKSGADRIMIACWWDFEDAWRNFLIIDNEYIANVAKVTHWMGITDILKLPVEKHNKWYVPIETIEMLKK